MKRTSRTTGGSRRSSRGSRASAVTSLLADFARVAGRRGLRWYVFGAQAVAVYGVPRTSADVDVTLEIPAGDVPAFVRELGEAGFHLRVDDVDAFVATTRVLPFEHLRSGWPLDVVLAGPGLEESFLDDAVPHEMAGMTVPLMAREDLIAAKVLAGRPKDLEDVRGILRQGETDLDRVRGLLGAIESALDQSDLVPLLDQLVREARQATGRRR